MHTFIPILTSYPPTEVVQLQQLAITTFIESYAEKSDANDMEKYMKKAFSISTLRQELANPYSLFYGIYVAEKVVAYMKINLHTQPPQLAGKSCIEVQRIYVLKAFQGHQFGAMLMQKAEEIARAHHREYIWLVVWDQNEAAVTFYRKKGFEMDGTVPFLFGNTLEEDCCMVKKMGDFTQISAD